MGDGPTFTEAPTDPVAENALVRSRIASENALRRAELESAFTRDLGALNKEIGAIEAQRFGLQKQVPQLDLDLLRAEAELKTAENQTKQLQAQSAVSGNINFDLGLDAKRKAVEDIRNQKQAVKSQLAGLASQAREVARGGQNFDFSGFSDLRPGEIRGAGSDFAQRDPDFREGFLKRQGEFESSELKLQSDFRNRLGGSPGDVALSNLEGRLGAESSRNADRLGLINEAKAAEEAQIAEAAAEATKQGQAFAATGGKAEPGGVKLPTAPGTTGTAGGAGLPILQQSDLLNQSNKLTLTQPITKQSNVLGSIPIKLGGN